MKKILSIIAVSLFSLCVQAETDQLNNNETKIEINIERDVVYAHTVNPESKINDNGDKATVVMVTNDMRDYRVLNSFYANMDGTLNLTQYIVVKKDIDLTKKYNKLMVSDNERWFREHEFKHTKNGELIKNNSLINDDYMFFSFNEVKNIKSNVKNVVLVDVSKSDVKIKHSLIVVSGKQKIIHNVKSIANYNGKFQYIGDVLWVKNRLYTAEDAIVAQGEFDFVTTTRIMPSNLSNKIRFRVKRLPDVKGDIVILPYVSKDNSVGYDKPIILTSEQNEIIIEF